jgi:hypothetical protein
MSDSPLRRAIQWDATGVGLLGLIAAAFAGPLADVTGLATTHFYLTAGAFVFYGVVGNLFARFQRVVGIGIGLSAFNFIGTMGALILVASSALPLTSAGKAVILACGAYTLVFGVMQFIGVRRARGVTA